MATLTFAFYFLVLFAVPHCIIADFKSFEKTKEWHRWLALLCVVIQVACLGYFAAKLTNVESIF